ncbi:MAG: hybrid sensor histidine kinase/response regulator [Myxococcota bacterium]
MSDSAPTLSPLERSELFEAQAVVLEESTRGSDLTEVLHVLCLEVEALLDEDAKCSVLLVEDGCVHHGAAPSLPGAYVDAIDGTPIGPKAGSCGTAAHTRERIIVDDIGTDPLWEDYRHIAQAHDLVACWSTPVIDGSGNLLATFAIYPPERTSPSDYEIAVLDAFSNVTGLVIERARAQSQLAAEKRRLASIVQGTGAGAWEWNPQTDEATVTKDWARILGYEVEELEPVSFETIAELAHPDDGARVEAEIQAHFQGETDFFESEFRMRHKSGRWIWLLDRGRVIERDDDGAPTLVAGMHLDITDRKRREQALRENEQDLALTLDSIADAVVTTNVDLEITRMNAVAEELTGRRFDDAAGCSITEILPFLENITLEVEPSDTPEKRPLIEDEVFELAQIDGTSLTISCSASLFRAAEDDGHRLVVSFRDISERHRIQAELRRSRDVLDRTSRLGQIGGWELDVRNDEIWMSAHARRILGRPDEYTATLERGFENIIEGGERVQHALQRTIEQGEPYQVDFLTQTSDGTKKWIRSTGRPEFEDGECVRIHGALQDVTTQRNTEKHLQRMQKLESLGRLAGGIAHDFNNILMGFFASVSFAADELEEGHPAHRELEEAQAALDRAKRLTGQLLTFAKGGAPVKDHVTLDDLVERVVRFDLSGSDIRPLFDIDDDLWPTKADPGQLQQVFSNLAVNAREAMQESGNLYISMQNTFLTASDELQLPPGRYIRACVRDEGPGISSEHIDRLFEPYFSSKEKGRGLGLATVYSVVNQHGGHVGVESSADGAEFIIHLPASTGVRARKSDTQVEDGTGDEAPVERARILVIDDEPAVRRACSRMLETLGHSVVSVDDGSTGIERYLEAAREGEPFELVITDLTIPGGMGGRETLTRLLEKAPAARVVASTGYTDDPVLANWAEYGFVGIAPKPYTLEQLAQVVRDALPPQTADTK